ncbi:MAG: ABC transporter substrate-binding protein [Desulfovibrionaceae bacterium]|nr:ABC transporter substrate-binding protein [Desulfovibrionaceae bacterium]
MTADVQKNTEYFLLGLNVFDRLVECAPGPPDQAGATAIAPGLAASWEISPDGLVYTFHLRPGVRFHDGSPLTAADVVYTIDRMCDPATKALNTAIFEYVAGARQRLEGQAAATSGVAALDALTVEIRLVRPFAPFLALLASPQAGIYSEKFTKAAGERFGLTPETTCGTGPFKLARYVHNSDQRLVANPDYFRGPPLLDAIGVRVSADPETLRMLFEAGEIDLFDMDFAPTQLDYFEASPKWRGRLVRAARVGLYYLAINNAKKPFNDERVRRALQLSIDRRLILDKMFSGQGALVGGVMAPGLACFGPRAPDLAFDPALARKLLAEAGYPDGAEAELVQVAGWPAAWADLAQVIAAQAAKGGFHVKIRPFDEAAFLSTRMYGDAPLYFQVWSADYNDPDNFFHTFFSASGTKVRSINLADAGALDAVETARSITDPEARCRAYRELERRIVEQDAAWLPLFSLDHVFVLGPRVESFAAPWNGWSDMSHFATGVGRPGPP